MKTTLKCKLWFLHNYGKWVTRKGKITIVDAFLGTQGSYFGEWQERHCKDCNKVQRKT